MEKSLKVLLPILFTFLIKTVCYAQSAVNGQGYIGKGQVISGMFIRRKCIEESTLTYLFH